MTVNVELDLVQVKEAVRQYAERMMPPGWFAFVEMGEIYAGGGSLDGYTVRFQPVERPIVAPEVYDGPREAPLVGEFVDPPPVRGDDGVEVGSNGVFIRV